MKTKYEQTKKSLITLIEQNQTTDYSFLFPKKIPNEIQRNDNQPTANATDYHIHFLTLNDLWNIEL
nr:MAG TPA: hypothetical protein [Bacteriophage sp.]